MPVADSARADKGAAVAGQVGPEPAEGLAQTGAGERLLCGWGRIGGTRATVSTVRREEEVVATMAAMAAGKAGERATDRASLGRGHGIARGMGRSYGDAAQSEGGSVLDMTGLDAILGLDHERMTVTAQAGATLGRLLGQLGAVGLTLPVLPGTCQVSVGGALAGDIHGKSHHCDGSVARHVRALRLCLPGGEVVELGPERERELFAATLGGMGLTGAIVSAELAVEPLRSPWAAEDVDRTADLEQTLALLGERDERRWSVAWLDLLARDPKALGRGVVSRADPWPAEPQGSAGGAVAGAAKTTGPLPDTRTARRATPAVTPRFDVPEGVPSGLLRPSLVRAFNATRWHRSPRRARERRVALGSYLFPLDALGCWSRLYGRQGLVQYQFVVPHGRERTLVRCVELLRARRVPVYLAVLKRFGEFEGGPLSFPIAGFTLALDMPGGAPGLWEAMDRLDEMVAEAGGRVYLCKDVRLRKDVLPAMYPQLGCFRAVRERVDPERALRSDLSRRLGL